MKTIKLRSFKLKEKVSAKFDKISEPNTAMITKPNLSLTYAAIIVFIKDYATSSSHEGGQKPASLVNNFQISKLTGKRVIWKFEESKEWHE